MQPQEDASCVSIGDTGYCVVTSDIMSVFVLGMWDGGLRGSLVAHSELVPYTIWCLNTIWYYFQCRILIIFTKHASAHFLSFSKLLFQLFL